MRLPPDTVLIAAKRWLEILPSSGGIKRAQAILTTHNRFSDLTPTQYASALAWLRNLGIIDSADLHYSAGNQILAAIFEESPPPWVRDADILVRSPDELPSDILLAGETLGLGPEETFAQLVISWGKVDTASREKVGAAGEDALVALLREETSGHVDQVSNRSDGFGYDIAFTDESVSVHLEVKSTTRRGRIVVYLSRNEYETMLRDRKWKLATVRLTPDFTVDAVGCVPNSWIEDNVPADTSTAASWASCRLELPPEIIYDGVPEIGLQSPSRYTDL